MKKEVSVQYLWQQKKIKDGKCRTCGKKRNKSKEFCDKHLKYNNKKRLARYYKNKHPLDKKKKVVS